MSGELTRQIFITPSAELEGKHAHGQFLFDMAGLFMNFACDVDEVNVGIVGPWADRLQEFLNSTEAAMEFDSPHLPGRCYLTRYGASKIVGVFPAWSDKVRAKATLPGTQLLTPTGAELPLVRKRDS